MARYFLRRLSVEGFRGINNQNSPLILEFKSDSVNSIFAGNGIGKSSLFEALHYAVYGTVTKLEKLNEEENAGDYYCNRFHTGGAAKIELTFSPDDGSDDVEIHVQRTIAGARTVSSPSGHSDPDKFLMELQSDLRFLDHKGFMDFIEDSPLSRGRTFSGLIGLSKISNFRQALQTLSHGGNINRDFQLTTLATEEQSATDQLEQKITRIDALYSSITGNNISRPFDSSTVISSSSSSLSSISLLTPFFVGKDILSVDFSAIRAEIRKTEQSDLRERLQVIIQQLDTLEGMAPLASESGEQDELKKLAQDRDTAMAATQGSGMHKLYVTTLSLFDSKEWIDPSKCPLCSSGITDPLDASVKAHLAQYEKFEDSLGKIQANLNSALWIKRLTACSGNAVLKTALKAPLQKLNKEDINSTIIDVEVAKLKEMEDLRKKNIEELTKEKEGIEKSLPPSLVSLTEKIEHAEFLATTLNEARDLQKTQQTKRDQLTKRKRWETFIKEADNTFSNAEAALSTAVITSLETEYKEIYKSITNNPEIIPILKRSTTTEDLHLRLEKFYSLSDLSATSLLPESYRNALAMAIFLSASLQDKSVGRFIVLDDVTSSFDSGHQFALMELIRSRIAVPNNTDGPQIILLSHDGLLEKYFDRLGGTSEWHHQKLQGLPPHGHVLPQAQDANRLRSHAASFLSAGQVTEAGPLIRQYLEFKLLQIIRAVQIPVPIDFAIRDDRQMVENSLNAIRDAVSTHNTIGDLILNATQISDLTGVHMPAIVGNWVTHYSTGVMSGLSARTLLGVLDSIDKFSDCFEYTCHCTGTAQQRRYKSLSQKACSC